MNETLAERVLTFAGTQGPLNGVLVVELGGNEPSGAFGTQILADLGATVIKIERVPDGDPPTYTGPAMDGLVSPGLAFFAGLNRNKRSVCLDLKSEDGRSVARGIATIADVVCDNFRPGVTERLGLHHEALKKLNKRVICCSVSGYGHTGPRRELAAFDATIQAQGGGMSLTGTGKDGSMPVRAANPIAGLGAAIYAALGILLALRQRQISGDGAFLDISMFDAQLAMHSYRVPSAMHGHFYGPQHARGGSGSLPYGPFLAGDGRWFVVGITEQFWPTMCRITGHPEWRDDPRFRTEPDRQKNEVELNRLVGEAIKTRSAAEWQEIFVEAGIPGGKVLTIEEAFAHPHVALRQMLAGFSDRLLGDRIKVAGNPVKLSSHPFHPFRRPPGLGEDTDAVFESLLGLTAAERERLRASGAAWWPRQGVVFERRSHV